MQLLSQNISQCRWQDKNAACLVYDVVADSTRENMWGIPLNALPSGQDDQLKKSSSVSWRWLLLLGFAAAVAVYFRVVHQAFVTYDDRLFIHINPHVLTGLSLENFLWAWRIDTPSMWHPLTWLSYQFNAQISMWQGYPLAMPSPVSFKLTNVFLHLISAGLLFGAIRSLTGRATLGAIIACVFLLHPANVESVAWVAERKNALSQVFVMACLWGYGIYAQRRQWRWLVVTTLLFFVGLLAKPAILTLPLVLLLLDYWPLERSRWQGGPDSLMRLVGEKMPLLLLSLVDGIITFINGRIIKVVVPLDDVSILDRIVLLPATYVRYLFHYLCPVTVGPMQVPLDLNWLHITGSIVLLLVVTAVIIHQYKRRPFLLVGWLWFIGTIFPMAGFIKTSQESMADRHLYYPGLGLLVAVVFLAGNVLEQKRWALPACLVLLLGLSVLSYRQVKVWDDSVSLYTFAISQSDNNVWAHNNLGAIDWLQGRMEQARKQFERALAIDPDYVPARENLQAVQAILHASNPLGARLAYARFTMKQGRLDYADKQLIVLYAMTNDPLVLAMRAELSLALNQPRRAEILLAAAVARSDNISPAGARQIAKVYVALGDDDQAREWSEQAQRLEKKTLSSPEEK